MFNKLKKYVKGFLVSINPDGEVFRTLKSFKWLVYVARVKIKIKFIKCPLEHTVLRKINELKKCKSQIKVIFIVRHASQWKYENIYRSFESSERYLPLIVLAPDLKTQNLSNDLSIANDFFGRGGYNIIAAYDDGRLIIKPENLEADIVFFPKAIEGRDPFSIERFGNALTCYVPYSTHGDNNPKVQYELLFHHLLWKNFVPTQLHKEMSIKANSKKLNNVIVSGYPGFDPFLFKSNVEYKTDPWKVGENKKRIIWAPHHTIESGILNTNHSNFIKFHLVMKRLVYKYHRSVFFAFKPHPNLRKKLADLPEWNEKKVSDYYDFWRNSGLTLLEEGGYVDLFVNSDAIIHDSVSFMAEYLCLKKPSCYVVKDVNCLDGFFNYFGRELLCHHTKVQSKNEMIAFIDNVVSHGNLLVTEDHKKFVDEVLAPPGVHSSSSTIVRHIENSLI
jgi:hypothetical protein